MKFYLRRSVLLLGIFCAACSPSQQIAELNAEFREEYRRIPDYDSLPVKRLSWAEALKKMEKGNLEYRQALQEYENAKRKINRVWRELIPMLDLGYYYNAPLKWGSGEPANYNLDVNVVFNLPGLVTLPVEQYMDALGAIKADTDCKLKKRELEARLYQCFREYGLQRRERQLEEEAAGEDEARKRLRRVESERKKRAQWTEIGKLFNDYSARWELDGRGVPEVDLSTYRLQTQTPDELLLSVMSLQFEASRLTKLGAALRFAPSVYVNFFSPSLFSSTGGEMDGFMRNADDVRINVNTYVRLDTRLDMYHDYKQAAKAHELTRHRLSQQMVEHKEKLALLMESWQKYLEWKDSMAEYVAFRNRQGVSGVEEALELHEESLELERSLIEQERANLERECAVVQEYGWR